jgi:hypothetical protein
MYDWCYDDYHCLHTLDLVQDATMILVSIVAREAFTYQTAQYDIPED